MSFGIICEYNPFHNGHLHQIKAIREKTDEPIVCVMSGNFTQRGEAAIVDKYRRAEMALRGGADIVLELPTPYCFAGAEYFASAGVYILNELGVDKLSFGSESADEEKIMRLSRIACSDEFMTACRGASRSRGTAESYFELLCERTGEKNLLPNDILALEYAKAIIRSESQMKIFPIKRSGSGYNDSRLTDGELPSATAIRECLMRGDFGAIKGFVPDYVFEILRESESSSLEYASDAIIFALRSLKYRGGVEVAVSDKGLVNRIIDASHAVGDYKSFLQAVQTKKYTKSGINRAVMYLILEIGKDDLTSRPAYVNLLGAGAAGREYLSEIRGKSGAIKIATKPADVPNTEAASRQVDIASRADALYTLCFKRGIPSGEYIKKSPVIL